MFDADFVLANLAFSRSPFVDPIRVHRGDLRQEWTFAARTDFEVKVLVDDGPFNPPSIFDILNWDGAGEHPFVLARKETDNITRHNAADAIAAAMNRWSGHKRMQFHAALAAAKEMV